MTSVLISGAEEPARQLEAALRSRGADVTVVTTLEDMPRICAEAGPSAFDSYVQLASTFQLRGATVIERVHHFYAGGVLARFPALAAALPTLADTARVTFVLGHLPEEVASSDDRDARRSLTKVLAHAARADAASATFSVRVLDSSSSVEQVVGAALGEESTSRELLERLSELDYADWRVEVLGRASMQT